MKGWAAFFECGERLLTPRRIGLVMVFCLAGCAVASAPIKNTPQVVATPQNGQLTTSVQAHEAVGDVEPVYVSVNPSR